MRVLRRLTAFACASLLLSLALAPRGDAQSQAQKPQADAPPFVLGVQTHFEQGWPPELIPQAKEFGAPLLRDEIAWSEVETQPGIYDFTGADSYMLPLASAGLKLQLVTMDGNPLYDAGMTPHSPEGRAAYARYLAAVAARYGTSLTEIELGNEVNSGEFLRGPYAEQPARHLAAQARALRAALPPEQKMICAGTNTIGLGFLREFFRWGGLEVCDGISVHPYRDHPETLDLDLARLRALMAEMGGVKPIHATEFGIWVEDPAEAGPWMLKMVAVMGAAGVQDAIWYALVDEPYWPNMGLLSPEGAEKPAAATFRLLQNQLLPKGRPQEISPSRRSRVYQFGPSAFVLWGSGAALEITGEMQVLGASGAAIPAPKALSDTPIVLLGPRSGFTLDERSAAHDQLYEFGTAPWSYFARRPGIGLTPLEIIDDLWTSHRSAPDLAPLRISDEWLTTARFDEGPFHAVERFTVPSSGRYQISGWWRAAEAEEGSKLHLLRGGTELASGEINTEGFTLEPFEVTLEAGDHLDFEIAPAGAQGHGAVERRIKLLGPLP